MSINIIVRPRTPLLSYIYFGTSGYFREFPPPPWHVRLLCLHWFWERKSQLYCT